MSDLLDKVKAGEEIDVYLTQEIKYGYTSINHMPISGYVTLGKGRCTLELVEEEEVIEQGLNELDQEIEKVRAQTHVKIEELKDRKAQLLSLTHQG